MAGPLTGVRIVEIAGLGPAPYACMLLADMGAEVLRVDRLAAVERAPAEIPATDFLSRGRRSLGADLKHPEAIELVLRLVEKADAIIEGFRPGVMERLGLGPDVCLARNPGLVYGRMTGWGQEGPMANDVGHDINYVALTGALHGIGRKGMVPVPPVNYVADFGGGGNFLALGVVAALLERGRSGKGQVVDAAMIDGVSNLSAAIHGAQQSGFWTERAGENLLDTGSHFYDVYETADGRFVSVGAIEPAFYAEFLRRLGLDGEELPHQMDRSAWPDLKARVSGIFKQRSRDEWCAVMEGFEVCFAPVLTMSEAREHPHNRARGTFVEFAGAQHPAPAPRFSRTRSELTRPPARAGEHTDEALADWGLAPEEIQELRTSVAIA